MHLPVRYAREGDQVAALAHRPADKRRWRNFAQPHHVGVLVDGGPWGGRDAWCWRGSPVVSQPSWPLQWVLKASRPLTDLHDPVLARDVLESLRRKPDGGEAGVETMRRKRKVLVRALHYAVKRGELGSHRCSGHVGTWRRCCGRTCRVATHVHAMKETREQRIERRLSQRSNVPSPGRSARS